MALARHAKPDPGRVLARALVRLREDLDFSQSQLGRIVGLHRQTVAALARGRPLDPASKEGELAAHLIRVYRSLFALTGGQRETMRHWLDTPNRELGERPRDMLARVDGLVQVERYLDAMRGTG